MSKNEMPGKITIGDLFNNQLTDVLIKLEKADLVAKVLQYTYLDSSQKNIEKDSLKAYEYQTSYDEIQGLVGIIEDYTFEAVKILKSVFDIKFSEIVGFTYTKNITTQ